MSPDNVIKAGVPLKRHLNFPIPGQAGAVSLVTSAPLLLLALSSDPPPPPCKEIGGGHPVTAQLNTEHPSPLLGMHMDGVYPPVRMTLLRFNVFLLLAQIWTVRPFESCKQDYDFGQAFFLMKPFLEGCPSPAFTQFSCHLLTGEALGIVTYPTHL